MGYYPAMRMVHILTCEDIDDFYQFRLDLFNSPDWKEVWDDGDVFGVKFKTTTLDVHFFDPDEHGVDDEGFLPYKLNRKKCSLFALDTRDQPMTIVQLENWAKRHRELLKRFKSVAQARKPALHIEPVYI